jgi:arylsulfatase A-like enzyme
MSAGLPLPAWAAEAAKPNVLFIAVDDLNDWVGCLGKRPDVKTPNIDRLAARGVLFTRAYCAAPACNPSRTALLTGLRPSTTGVYHNDQPWRPVLRMLSRCQHFATADYRVGQRQIFHNAYNDQASWQSRSDSANPVPKNKPVNGLNS